MSEVLWGTTPVTWGGVPVTWGDSGPPATPDAAGLVARLVAYEPRGARLGILPAPLTWSATFARNDVGAASLTYSRVTARGAVLQRTLADGLEVAVEVWNGAAWVEPDGGRFIAVKRGWAVDDRTDTVTLTMPSYGWLWAKIRSLNVAALMPEGHSEEGKRAFLSENAGTIIATILGEYEGRYSETVARDFTTGVDSNGQPWDSVTTIYYEHGTPLDSIVGSLVGMGLCDVTTRGRTMSVTNTSDGTDRSEAIRLHLGRDISEAPSEETIEDLISHIAVHGGGGLHVTESDPTAPTPWGPWEGFYGNDSITTTATALSYAQAELARSGRIRGQYTRDVLASSRHRALVDFGVGDWITAPTVSPSGERVRVEAVTLRQDATGPLVAGLTLNDRFLDAEVKRARRSRGIVLGSATSEGGSPVRPAPTGPDQRRPAKVTGVVAGSSAYIDANGQPQGIVSVTWAQVTTARAEDGGAAMDVRGYEVSWRLNEVGALWRSERITQDTGLDFGPVDVGAAIQVRVRALGTYATTPGDWSDPVTLTVADDTTPPPIPSDLTGSSSRGVVSWAWDGLTETGTAMPRDFLYVLIEWEGVDGGSPVSGQDRLYGRGMVHVPGLDAGSLARARARAVDRSGNLSDRTGWEDVTVASVLDGTGVTEALDSLSDDVADIIGNVIPPLETAVSLAIVSSVVEYAVAASETTPPTTGWSSSTPTRTPGTYIWYRTKVTYGDASTSVSSPALLTGNDGAPGADGTSVNIVGSVANAASLPTLGSGDAGDGYVTEDDGHLHVWDGSSWTDVGEIRGPEGQPGAPGSDGADGVGIESVTPYFRTTTAAASAPAAPTTNPPPAPWTTTEPAYAADTALWRTERIVYDNADFAYTTVTKVSAYTAATEARSLAITADGRVTASTAAPTAGDATGKANGSLWYRYTGNALVGAWRLVSGSWVAAPLDRTFIPAIDIGTGTFGDLSGARLAANTVVASDALVVGSIDDPVLIADGTITAPKIYADQAFANKVTAALGEFDGVNAGWITSTMLSLGVRGRNLMPDPSFEDDYDLEPWDPFGSWSGSSSYGPAHLWRRGNAPGGGSVTRSTVASRARSGGKSLALFAKAGNEAGAGSPAFRVESGKTYRVILYVAALGSTANLVVTAPSNAASANITPLDTAQTLTGDATWANIPATAEPFGPGTFDQRSYTFTATITGWVMLRVLNYNPPADSTLIVDDVSVIEVGLGGAAELTSAGLRLFDDSGMEVGAFVTGRPNYFAIGNPEDTLASIDVDGDAAFQGLDVVHDPTIDGRPLLGNMAKWEPPTDSVNIVGHVDKLPWGGVRQGTLSSHATYSASAGLIELGFPAMPGRTYKVTFTGALTTQAVADRPSGFRVSLSTPATFVADGSAEAVTPSYASPGTTLGYSYAAANAANGFATCPSRVWWLRCNPNGMAFGGELHPGMNKLLLSVVLGSGQTSLVTNSGEAVKPGLLVEDCGPDMPESDATAAQSGTQPSTGTFTTTWSASDSETYNGSNVSRGSGDRGDVIHGYTPDAPSNGINWGHILFGGGATGGSERGKTLASALTGATIHKAELDVYVAHSWYTSGGQFAVRARTDASVNHSSATPVTTTAVSGSSQRRGVWVTLDVKAIVATTTRGIQVGKTASTDPRQYLRISGHTSTQRPRLRVTYSR